MQLIATIDDPTVIRKILTHLGLPTEVPCPRPPPPTEGRLGFRFTATRRAYAAAAAFGPDPPAGSAPASPRTRFRLTRPLSAALRRGRNGENGPRRGDPPGCPILGDSVN